MINRNGVFYFERFLEFPHLVHGFSTREFGNMRPTDPKVLQAHDKFLHRLGQSSENLVRMNQVHSNHVAWVGRGDKGTVKEKTDGLLSDEKDVLLSVITADCVPLLLFDPEKQLVSAIHAGWRGIYKEIIKEIVGKMVEKGSKPTAILAGIGPCIGVCCYEVDTGHADAFHKKFSQWEGFYEEREEKVFLNLPLLVKYQLQSVGIRAENIEDGEICTADTLDEFYSCRREGTGFGEFMGIIGRV